MKNSVKPTVLPSLLSADMGQLAEQVHMLQKAGCRMFHVDIMDGHFVPNMTFGPGIVRAISDSAGEAELCVHLMIERPEQMIEKFQTEKVKYMTVHQETCPHLHRTLQQIAELGMKPGIALNPGTPASAVEYVLQDAGLVLPMSVNPGWGGQKFIEAVVPKIATLARWLEEREDFNYLIEVDGGINESTIPTVVQAGARLLVAGNAVYGQPDPVEAFRRLSQMAEAV